MTDVFSWGDSDPFEEDDSWMSEPESVCNNWRGWKKAPSGSSPAAPGAHLGAFVGAGPSNGGAGTSSGLADYSTGPAAAAASLDLSSGGGNSVVSQTMADRLAAAVANAAASAAAAASSYAQILNSPASGVGGLSGHPPHHHLLNPHRPSSPTYEILNSSLRGESFLYIPEFILHVSQVKVDPLFL